MKTLQPGGHIDQLLRQTRWHHVQLSAMADAKANMIFTVSSVVITLSIRYITEPRIRWPAFTLIGFCLITIVMAAYAVMPKMAVFDRPSRTIDAHSPAFNLLFFGDFIHLDYEHFEQAMEETLSDPARSYEVMVREIYLLGVFLGRKKYRFVRLSYLTFIAGLVVSGVVFAGAEALRLQ